METSTGPELSVNQVITIQREIIHYLRFPFISYASLEKVLLLALHIFLHLSTHVMGGFEGVEMWRGRWKALVGLFHQGSAEHPLGSWRWVWWALWRKKQETTRRLDDRENLKSFQPRYGEKMLAQEQWNKNTVGCNDSGREGTDRVTRIQEHRHSGLAHRTLTVCTDFQNKCQIGP